METTVHLHGGLPDGIEEAYTFFVSKPSEAISALCNQVKGFKDYLRDKSFHVMNGDNKVENCLHLEELELPHGEREIHITPVLRGSGGVGRALGVILLGAAMIGLGVYIGAAYAATAWAAAVSSTAIAAGTGLIVNGVLGLLSPSVNAPNNEELPGNSLFDGARVRSTVGAAVPIAFGRVRTGGVLVAFQIDIDDEVTEA